MIKEGQKAPNFNLPNQNGEDTSLSDFLGKKIVLWFFPRASTPGWTTEGQGFRDELEHFNNKDISIIGMSADSVQKQKNFCDKQNYMPMCSIHEHVIFVQVNWSHGDKVEKSLSTGLVGTK